MKKITVIILMVVYGMSSSGMCVSADYCCGKLSKLGVSLNQKENSQKDFLTDNKKCCDHKQVSFKVKADHQTTAKQHIDFSNQPILQPAFYTINYNWNSLNNLVLKHSTGPPLFKAVPMYISNCVFRI